MSNKKNYNKISTENVVVDSEEKSTLDVVKSEEVIETKEEPVVKVKIGVVSNCEKLNVREKPNVKSVVACIITKGTEVEIDESKSSREFYRVSSTSKTEGFAGYCMKKYITVKQ